MKRTKTTGKRCSKIQYKSQREAQAALATLRKEGKVMGEDRLVVYKCNHCAGRWWHLGTRDHD
mgnify:FL=1